MYEVRTEGKQSQRNGFSSENTQVHFGASFLSIQFCEMRGMYKDIKMHP